MNRPCRHRRIASLITAILLAFGAASTQAAIPASERAALLALYANTDGARWNNSTNWNGGAGTECTWYGIACDSAQSTVTGINLNENNLSGSLPGTLNTLTNLANVYAYNNQLTGTIPALTGLSKLSNFYVNNNELTGTIPALDGLSNLGAFYVSNNQLTGSIPSLDGLKSLIAVDVGTNQLTGTIPPLAGLSGLTYFSAKRNQLTGPIPSLAGLTNLSFFYVGNNQLSGTIPPLAGLTNLVYFDVGTNQLTGSIPDLTSLTVLTYVYVNNNALTGPVPALSGLSGLSAFSANSNQLTGTLPTLAGLANLSSFSVNGNQLTGSIPSLAGLTTLSIFSASNNQLTGAIPPLAGLTALTYFYVRNNQLTGTIPELAGLTNLAVFDAGINQLAGSIPALTGLTGLNRLFVDGNQLTGDVPTVPVPNALTAGGSNLCPNDLNANADPAWDAATGQSPWYARCGGSPTSVNYQGLWWKADESGWGVNFAHAGDQIFATWYTYDAAGKAWWLSMLASRTTPTGTTFIGDIYVDVGPPFNNYAGSGTPAKAGSGQLTMADADDASFAYTVNLVSQTKALTRFDLGTGAQPTCVYSAATPDFAAATNYQDLWWVAGGAESGWGVNFAHQGNSIFATWYTYDVNNAPLWLSALVQREGTGNVYTGTINRTSGPRYDAYNTTKLVTIPVGTATFAFADGNHATFGYSIPSGNAGGLPAANQSKQITRFAFAASGGTVCN